MIKNGNNKKYYLFIYLVHCIATVTCGYSERGRERERETLGIGAKGMRDLGSKSSSSGFFLAVPNFLGFFCFLGIL
jgi:hypothetical protein